MLISNMPDTVQIVRCFRTTLSLSAVRYACLIPRREPEDEDESFVIHTSIYRLRRGRGFVEVLLLSFGGVFEDDDGGDSEVLLSTVSGITTPLLRVRDRKMVVYIRPALSLHVEYVPVCSVSSTSKNDPVSAAWLVFMVSSCTAASCGRERFIDQCGVVVGSSINYGCNKIGRIK
jgi:hypothetical protein